jgi:hypothetical protein
MSSTHYPTHREPRARPPLAVLTLAAVVLSLPIVGCGAWIWLRWIELAATWPAFSDTIRMAIFALPLAGASAAGAVGLSIAWRRWGWAPSIKAHNKALKIRARTQIAPLATSFTYHTESAELQGDELLALPAPIAVVKPLDEWLRWLDTQPHCLLGGRTKAGKTTTATAILAQRLARRETVFIVDPHSGDWLGLPTAGRVSGDIDELMQALIDGKALPPTITAELKRALGAVLALYLGRMRERDEHKQATGRELPHGHFGRMTVLIDEANAIAELLPAEWAMFAKLLASGSRKIGISLLILAQSPLVDDLKISSKMRSNFAAIALDEETVRTMIGQCTDKARKEALQQELIGIGDDYPASAHIGAEVWLLDRAGLGSVIEPADAHTLTWPGWDYAAGRPNGQPPASGITPPGTHTIVTTGAELPATIGPVRLSWLIAKMTARDVAPDKIGAVLASFVLRVAPTLDRAAVAGEIERRAVLFAEAGNAATIAAQLDRDQLIQTCLDVGADVATAVAIYGGKRQAFYEIAKTMKTTREHGNTPATAPPFSP